MRGGTRREVLGRCGKVCWGAGKVRGDVGGSVGGVEKRAGVWEVC